MNGSGNKELLLAGDAEDPIGTPQTEKSRGSARSRSTYVSSQSCIQTDIHGTKTLPHINVYFSERRKGTTMVADEPLPTKNKTNLCTTDRS